MNKGIGYLLIFVAMLHVSGLFAQAPADTMSATPDTTSIAIYQPKATFENFKLLKQEASSIGIGAKTNCQNYYGIFYICEFEPYTIGMAAYDGQKCTIQYKISGNDSLKANLILITAELHNPDHAIQASELFVDVIRKTMTILGEPMPDGLRPAISNRYDFRIRTKRGYTVRLKVYHSSFDALELKIDATGMN